MEERGVSPLSHSLPLSAWGREAPNVSFNNPLFASDTASDSFESAIDASISPSPLQARHFAAPPSPPSSSPAHPTDSASAPNVDIDDDDDAIDANGDAQTPEEGDPDATTITPVPLFRMLSAASDKWDLLLMIAGSLGALCFGLVQPGFFVFFGKMINASGDNADNPKYLQAELSKLAFSIFTISTTALITMWVESTSWMYTAERQVCKLRYNLLKAVLYQDVEFFDTKSKAAQIAGVMSTDIGVIHSVIGFKMGKFVQYMTTFVAGTCVGLYYCWQLALLTIATVPVTAVLAGIYSKAAVKIAAKVQAAINKAAIVVEETISQIRTIYSYTSESRQIRKFINALEEKVQIGKRGGLVKGLGLGALVASVNLSWGLLLWFGGVLVTKEGIKAGNIITATFSIIYAGQALGTATECLQSFANAKISTARVFQLINRKPSILNTDEGEKPHSITGTIVLRSVSFRYKSRPNVRVLDDVSLEIPATKIVALVGSSGSGKSTIISLIERYYDPEKGEIFLDGINLKTLNLKWLRSHIGLVGQEPVLFATSIVENLLYARKDATMAEIETASKAANAHSFIIQLPHGYQTQVGEGGTQLSGGQRQRLAIARAILQNPPILLLDEATSALDTQSERLVQNALEGFMQSRTTVVVAHRLSTIRNADRIVLLHSGQIIETGTHNTLMKLGPKGAYYSSLQMQTLDTDQKKKPVGNSSLNSPLLKQKERSDYRSHNQSISFSPLIPSTPVSPYLSTPIHISAASGENSTKISKAIEKSGWSNYGTRKMMMSFMRRLISAKKKELCLATLSAMLNGATMPVFLFFLYEVCIAYINKDKSAREKKIEQVLLLLGILAFFSFTSNILQHLNLAKSGEFLVKDVMDTKFRALLKKKVSWYDQEQNNSGVLMETFLEIVTPINLVITDFAGTMIKTASTLCVCVGLALKASWPLALVMMALLPVTTFGSLQRGKDVKCTHSQEMKKACANANIIASEAINNLRTVASLTAEEKILEQFEESLKGPLSINSKKSLHIGLIITLGHSALLLSISFVLYVSALLVGAKKSTFLRCLQASQVLTFTAESLGEAIFVAPILESARKSFNTIASIIGTSMEEEENNGNELATPAGRIEFAKVKFAYPSRPGTVVLCNFNLDVPAGKTIALVGRSGCGKSSVLALLQRFYEPQSGQIRLDGINISTLGICWLRQQMALVPQQPVLFTGSIEENIRYGKENATDSEVKAAARVANADGFVSALPEGYRTQVGNKGVKLSGGQKQRIAIARAVLRQGRVMLLDEATSALDAESEGKVQEALERAAARTGATVLVVAHRLATVKSAHSIAVVEEGRVAELGQHSLLIQRPSGLYAQLARLQSASK